MHDLILPIGMVIIILFWRYKGATPGKMAMHIKVVDAATGGPLNFWQCVARYGGWILSMLFMLLGFFWIIFDSRKQGWHDKIARTMVVRC